MKYYVCLTEHSFSDGDYTIMPVQPDHIESIRLWRNAQLDVLRQPAPISPEGQVDYYAAHIWPSMTEQRPSNILVSYLYRGIPIGYGGLVHIAWSDMRSEVSFLLDPERSANASVYAAEFRSFLKLIKRLAFDELNFHRLFTETFDIRKLHLSTLEQSGFLREGVMRQHVRIDGRPIDSIIHGCLRNYEK